METNVYTEKYKKIARELILKNFQELRNKRIYVKEAGKKSNDKYYAFTAYFLFFSIIKVGRRLRRASVIEIKSALAHELGHILRFESIGFFEKLWKGFRYFTSRKIRTDEENRCDKISIEKGYARGLYSIKSKKRKKHKYSGCYLTPKQVKSYAKSIDKW